LACARPGLSGRGPGGDDFEADKAFLSDEDAYSGGSGRDSLDYSRGGGPVSADLAAGRASGPAHGLDQLSSIENAIGTASGDTISGTGGANELSEGPGDDLLEGLAGDDISRG